MEKRPTHLITSGFSSTILLFKENDDGGFEKKILHEEEENSNYSFMVRNKNLPGIFYVVHELEDFDGDKSGAISRWKLHDDKTFTKYEVLFKNVLELTTNDISFNVHRFSSLEVVNQHIWNLIPKEIYST